MLVLTRKVGEGIKIDDDIYVEVIKVKGKQVRIGIQAPRSTKIHRTELEQNVEKVPPVVPSQESKTPENV